MKKRVVVGMSGGVDSSVAVYLLQEQGYEVVGITFKFIEDFDPKDAIDVANTLGIEHHVVDYTKDFKTKVIDTFISDYMSLITPNPCVMCNRDVKIKFLYDEMVKHNCDYLATGHYARFDKNKLYRSKDLHKDQTYFLSLVPYTKLSHIIFPLEGVDKTYVREVASRIGLSVADKKDSTDVCFINDKFKTYIKEHIPVRKGKIVNIENNEILGEHDGLAFYTIGQRRGLNIGGTADRAFVVGKNKDENILYIAIGDSTDYLKCNEILINDVNLISYHHPTFCTVKYRYGGSEVEASLEYLENNEIKVTFLSDVRAVTPGQTCAIYLGEECIGGGIIRTVMKDGKKLWYL